MQVFGLFLNFNVNKKSALKMNYEFEEEKEEEKEKLIRMLSDIQQLSGSHWLIIDMPHNCFMSQYNSLSDIHCTLDVDNRKLLISI